MLERRSESEAAARSIGSAHSFTTFGPPELTVVRSRSHEWYARRGKRIVDLVVALSLLVVLLPLMIVIWAALTLTLGRHVLLVQHRVGRGGVTYGCLKFRTMRPDRRSIRAPFHGVDRRTMHKSPDDPRHTPLGRVLRRYSLDELPQLWNVVRGQMSLVGPRPEMEMHVSAAFRSHCRHDIRPGLTGPFQLSAMRARGDLIAGLRLDEHYVRHISPRYDLVLLVRTFGAVFRGTGG